VEEGAVSPNKSNRFINLPNTLIHVHFLHKKRLYLSAARGYADTNYNGLAAGSSYCFEA